MPIRRLRVAATAASVAVLGAAFGVLAIMGYGRRGYAVRYGVAYGEAPGRKLDLFTPEGAPDSPVVVFFYGGTWESGSRQSYRFVGRSLAAAGVTVAVPDYRRYPETVFPGFMEDGAAAVAWVWRNLARDRRRRLFVAGHSAGAHIAALLSLDRRHLATAGVDRDILAGTIGLSGPYDFLPLRRGRLRAIFPEPLREASQPIGFVDGTAPPMLLVTGDADYTVEPGNTERLAARIRERGGVVRAKLYAGVGHVGPMAALVPLLPYRRPSVRADILAFVKRPEV